MEKEKLTSTTPSTAIPSQPLSNMEATDKHIVKKLFIALGIIIAACVLIVGTITACIISAVVSDCHKHEAATSKTSDDLINELKAVKIDGRTATSTSSSAGTGCVDANPEITVWANYNYSAQSVTTANEQVLKDVHSTGSSPITEHTAADISVLSALDTTIHGDDGKDYTATYSLTAPVDCQHACNLKTIDLTNLPVKSVTLSISETAHY